MGQEAHNEVWEEDLTKKYIWRKFIFGRFGISYITYLNMLGINARKELNDFNQKIIEMKNANQPTLFGLIIIFFGLISACGVPVSRLASTCAERYPVKADTVTVTRTVTDTVVLLDTYMEYVDTTECPPSDTAITIVKTVSVMVPGKTVYSTHEVHDTMFVVVDSAHVAALKQELEACNQARIAAAAAAATGSPGGATNNDGLPWWWLLIVGIGGFLIRNFLPRKQKA